MTELVTIELLTPEECFQWNFRRLRTASGLSQARLADKLCISRAALGSYEEGRALPPLGVMVRIAAYFGCTLDSLAAPPLNHPGRSVRIRRAKIRPAPVPKPPIPPPPAAPARPFVSWSSN